MTKKVISIFLALLLALSTFAVTASAYDRMDLDDLMMHLDQARMQAMMDGKISPDDDLFHPRQYHFIPISVHDTSPMNDHHLY